MVVRRNIYKGVYLQRGSGVGSVLSLIFRALVPWIKRGASALIRSKSVRRLAASAGKTAVKSASKMAQQAIAGTATKQTTAANLKRAKRGIQEALSKAIQPEPKKKKRVVTGKRHRSAISSSLI